MRFGSFVITLGLAGAIPACNRDQTAPGPGEGGPAVEPLALADFIEQAEVSYCAWAARCGGHPDEDTCRAVEAFEIRFDVGILASGYFAGQGAAATEYLLRSVEAGRIEYDGEAAAACLGYVDARGCFAPGTYAPSEEEQAGRAACGQIFRGTMTRNGPCMIAAECAEENGLCGTISGAEECAPGGCRAYAALGGRCSQDGACGPGNYCGSDPNSGQQVCRQLVALGDSCSNGESCVAGAQCDYDDYTCRPRLGEGEACVSWNETCAAGLYCKVDDFASNGACAAFSDRGGPCSPQSYISGCARLDDYCDLDTARCVALAEASGVSCWERPCAYWEYCDYQDERCKPRASAGEACGEDFTGDTYKYVTCVPALQCSGLELATSTCEVSRFGSACEVPELAPPPDEG